MRKELRAELLEILNSAVALVLDSEYRTQLENSIDEFFRRTGAIEMNEDLTDAEVDSLETIKSEIAKLVRKGA